MKDYNEMIDSLFERREKYQEERRKKLQRLRRAASIVSCCCLIILAGVGAWRSDIIFQDPAGLLGEEESSSEENSSSVSESLKEQGESEESAGGDSEDNSYFQESDSSSFNSGSAIKANMGDGKSDSQSAGNSVSSNSSSVDLRPSEEERHSTNSNDINSGNVSMPANSGSDSSEAPHSGGGGSSAPPGVSGSGEPKFYGGKYIDQSGNTVILLTTDTAANRTQICQDFGLSEQKVIFKKADYSLSYLREIQDKISEAMRGKALSFVVESALMEDKNRIRVVVTTKDEKQLAKLQSLDSKGGAIKIVHATGGLERQE